MVEMNSVGSGLSRLLMHFVWRLKSHVIYEVDFTVEGDKIHLVLLPPSLFFKN